MARTCSAIVSLAASSTALGSAPALPVKKRPALGQITVDGVVRRGLIRHDVGIYPAPHELWEDFGGIAQQSYGYGLLVRAGALNDRQRLVQRARLRVEISCP